MTTDELERDLKVLAGPRESDERLRLEIRTQLGERWQAHPRRRRQAGFAFGAAAVSAAAIAVAIILLIGTGGPAGPSSADAAIIRHAIRAITSPPNTILHVKETGVQDGTPVSAEWWQQTSPPHAIRMIKGSEGAEAEMANDGTTWFRYEPGTNTVFQRPDSSAPTLIDPVSIVRQQLVAGSARVDGTVTIDGESLYKVALPSGVVGYFDRTDYRPRYLDNPQRDGSVVRAKVVTYEELSATPENAKLLSITAQHPNAQVETDPGDVPDKAGDAPGTSSPKS
jgi:hypothetical protein